jgi:hypothetical protein
MNLRHQNIRYFTPYHVFNPFQSSLKNNFVLDMDKDKSKYNFSQIGYQIMNPSIISYHLEPIYSTISTIRNRYSSREVGKPVYDDNNNLFSYGRSITSRNNNTDRIIRSLSHRIGYENNYRSPDNYSTNDITKSRNNDYTFRKNNNKLEQSVSPFIKLLKHSYAKNSNKFNFKSSVKKTEIEWLNLFKNFVNIYIFFSSAKKYSCIQSKIRNKLINERIRNVVNDIAVLKDWIISMEDSFFSKFRNYKKFNGDITTQGDQNLSTKKNILNNIKIYINDLEYNLDEIPENVQSILYKYIKNNSYYPKKYLSKFELNRIDFNFYGATKNLTLEQGAMILSYLIINGVTVQQILLHIKEVFIEYENCDDIETAAINLGSVLHNLVKKIFRKKLKLKNDILALFNYYRNYHLFDEKLEKLKDKFNQKITIEENDKEDLYNKNLLPLNNIKIYFNENNKKIEEFMEMIYHWAIELTKNLLDKFSSSLSKIKKNSKVYKIKSKLIKTDD